MKRTAVIVCDIGKTNVKVCVVSDAGSVLWAQSCGFASLPGPPYRHLDVDGIWAWLLSRLRECAKHWTARKLIVAAHGATCALLNERGLALPVLDYEDAAPDQVRGQYERVRPPFAETLSPPLPGSLNYGRGIYWIAQAFPERFAKVRHIVNYAQYWSFKLSGVVAGEVSSIGSHSDLWAPRRRGYSSLVDRLGWQRLFPPLRFAGDALGPVRPQLDTGLSPDCQVLCGIHDSNATLLPWLGRAKPFTVCSTGTWIINLAVGAPLDRLDPQRDCAANVSVYGDPVASSRWMGGREYELLDAAAPAEAAALCECLRCQAMFLPPQGGQGGPFQHRPAGASCSLARASPQVRAAAASLYCALVQDCCLDLSSPAGPLICVGPFAGNELFAAALAALRPEQPVLASTGATDTALGAARLALPSLPAPPVSTVAPLAAAAELRAYRRAWRRRAEAS